MPKKNRGEELKRNNAPLNGALKFFAGGCLAELYLFLVRKNYVDGDVTQMLYWDELLPKFMIAGLVLFLVGGLLLFVWKKGTGHQKTFAWTLLYGGLFLSGGNWLVRTVYPNGVTILCFLTAAIMLLGVLWCLYARDCFFALAILGSGIFAAWVCRHGMNSYLWRSYVLVGAAAYIILLAAVVFTARKLEKTDGVIGGVRILPKNPDCTVVLVSCGLSALGTLVSLFSATAGYYAMWALAIVVFILAVFYTVREL
jgi:hypothetical protein